MAGEVLKEDGEAQELLRELRRIYHSSRFNGRNQWTLPPLGEDLPTPPPMPKL